MHEDLVAADGDERCCAERVERHEAGQLAFASQILPQHGDQAPRCEPITSEAVDDEIDALRSIIYIRKLIDELTYGVLRDTPGSVRTTAGHVREHRPLPDLHELPVQRLTSFVWHTRLPPYIYARFGRFA